MQTKSWRAEWDSNPRLASSAEGLSASVIAPDVGAVTLNLRPSDDVSGISVSPRECDCPEWVLRCCHFDDVIVVLVEDDDSHRPHRDHVGYCYPFAVGTITGYKPCPDCGLAMGVRSKSHSQHPGLFNEADAIAAFYTAEEELLRGAS